MLNSGSASMKNRVAPTSILSHHFSASIFVNRSGWMFFSFQVVFYSSVHFASGTLSGSPGHSRPSGPADSVTLILAVAGCQDSGDLPTARGTMAAMAG